MGKDRKDRRKREVKVLWTEQVEANTGKIIPNTHTHATKMRD